MEKANVITLLEKYWRTETSVEEEQALAAWFNTQDPDSLDPDLEPYSALFAYFGEESRVNPGPDFESRILQAITPNQAISPKQTRSPLRHFDWSLISAAATVLVLVASLFLFQPTKTTTQPSATTRLTTGQATARVTDTYNDPGQALAAVRHALLIASAHLNEGRKQITNK
jgi:hypothetical protein